MNIKMVIILNVTLFKMILKIKLKVEFLQEQSAGAEMEKI